MSKSAETYYNDTGGWRHGWAGRWPLTLTRSGNEITDARELPRFCPVCGNLMEQVNGYWFCVLCDGANNAELTRYVFVEYE